MAPTLPDYHHLKIGVLVEFDLKCDSPDGKEGCLWEMSALEREDWLHEALLDDGLNIEGHRNIRVKISVDDDDKGET